MDSIKLTGNGETVRRVSQANGFAWKVSCSEESIQRLQEWSQDPVMKKMLGVLRCIPHILVPRDIPRKDAKSYFADPPDRAEGWFCAGELSDCQSLLEHNNITVNELWITAADLCQTLCRLYDLGIWGNAERGSLLLRKPKNGELKFCLTSITDFHVYQYPQVFREAAFSGEDPVTSGLCLLVGGAALCADLSGGEELPLSGDGGKKAEAGRRTFAEGAAERALLIPGHAWAGLPEDSGTGSEQLDAQLLSLCAGVGSGASYQDQRRLHLSQGYSLHPKVE